MFRTLRAPLLALLVCGLLAYILFMSSDTGPLAAGPAVGRPAPDFTGRTLDGAEFRLSDHKGEVVVLDFWATWCGPCIAMIPHERHLVQRFSESPFAFIGISADESAEQLRAFIRSRDMTWTQVHDGPGGPIQRLYEAAYLPAVYVIDSSGVIRFKGVREQELERAIEKLLVETER
jgi:thiol-disulfide isomerase/thioredoxin